MAEFVCGDVVVVLRPRGLRSLPQGGLSRVGGMPCGQRREQQSGEERDCAVDANDYPYLPIGFTNSSRVSLLSRSLSRARNLSADSG